MVGHTGELLEPPERHLGKDLAFIGDFSGEHLVKGADTVRSNDHDTTGAKFSIVAEVHPYRVLCIF